MTNKENTPGKTIDQLFKELGSSPKGLKADEARARLAKYGTNEVAKKKKVPPFLRFLEGFKNPLVIILMVAAIISGATGEIKSAIIIISMILLSTVMNFVQEFRSMKAADKVAKRLQLKVDAIRNGEKIEILAKEVVPGDILFLEAGSIVCADGRIIEADDFFVNESALTGESFPVEKFVEGNLKLSEVMAGTTVVSGFGKMLVIKTGSETEYGKVADTLTAPGSVNAFEIGVKNFGYLIVKAVFFIVLAVFLINAFMHKDMIDSFLFSLAIAVGVTPELLPVILSINMAKASVNMSKRGVIVKRLDCIPDFGSMDVLCTDKTGTLTQDKITLMKYTDVHGGEDESVLRFAYINGNFETGIKSLLDKAILDFKKLEVGNVTKIDEIPYDFMRRRSSIIYEQAGQRIMVTKGAPEEIFKICTQYHLDGDELMTPEKMRQFKAYYDDLSRQGFRVLAIANKYLAGQHTSHVENNMTLRGFIAFYDPPKQEIKATLENIEAHGIEIKILTGDSALVTSKICSDLNINVKGIITGEDIDINALSDDALAIKVINATICARLSPSQKERIINVLRTHGKVVGYLGDGINDAPALKAADVGISVDNAVDVAKETADIILLRKGLDEIMEGVIEGRRTFGNAMKYMLMALSSNFGNMFSMIGAAFFLPFLPMTAGQILLNNFIYDTSQLSIPTDNVDKEYLQKPKQWNIKFIRNYMLIFGFISTAFDWLTFYFLFGVLGYTNGLFQAGWFFESFATQTLVIFVIRTRRIPFLQSRPSKYLAMTICGALVLVLAIATTGMGKFFGFEKLPFHAVLIISSFVLIYLLIVELVKHAFYKKFRSQTDA